MVGKIWPNSKKKKDFYMNFNSIKIHSNFWPNKINSEKRQNMLESLLFHLSRHENMSFSLSLSLSLPHSLCSFTLSLPSIFLSLSLLIYQPISYVEGDKGSFRNIKNIQNISNSLVLSYLYNKLVLSQSGGCVQIDLFWFYGNRLSNSKSIFLHINSSISNYSV